MALKKAITNKIGKALESINKADFPVAYGDDIWSIINSGTSLSEIFGIVDNYLSQDDINEKLAKDLLTLKNEIVEIIDDNEYVISSSLNDLNVKIKDIIKIINDNEYVISSSLNDLNNRISDGLSTDMIEDGSNTSVLLNISDGTKTQHDINEAFSEKILTLLEQTSDISISISSNMSNIVLVGTTSNSVNINFTIGGSIVADSYTVDLYEDDIKTKTMTVTDKDTHSFTDLILNENDKKIYVTVKSNGIINISAKSNTLSINHVKYTYYGVITETIAENITESTDLSDISDKLSSGIFGKNTSKSIVFNGNFIQKRLFIAIPSDFNDLKTIKDVNGFDYIKSYTKIVNTTNGYKYYIQNNTWTCSDSTYTLTYTF